MWVRFHLSYTYCLYIDLKTTSLSLGNNIESGEVFVNPLILQDNFI